MHRLEKYQHMDEEQYTNTRKPCINVTIYDAVLLLHTLKLSETYGGMDDKIVEIDIRFTKDKELHMLFDT